MLFLTSSIGGPGRFQGYRQLIGHLCHNGDCSVVTPKALLRERILGAAYCRLHGWPDRNSHAAAAEFWFSRRFDKRRNERTAHILAGEYHLHFLDRWPKAPKELIYTLHFPPSRWNGEMRARLKRLSSAIVLYQKDIAFFEEHVGKGRVHFVRHGVNSDFFTPGETPGTTNLRLVFAGHYLRNTEMLFRVVTRLHTAHPQLRFDFLVPMPYRSSPGLESLLHHPAVQWHANLDDTQVREVFRSALLVLLPVNDSGANNAVVESLSCGTPLVTTDVGGIRDYGGDSIFPLVRNNDDDAMVALVERYLAEPAWRRSVGEASRRFAEEELSWNVVAREHAKAYSQLAGCACSEANASMHRHQMPRTSHQSMR